MFQAVAATLNKYTARPEQNLLPLHPRNVNTAERTTPFACLRLAEGRFQALFGTEKLKKRERRRSVTVIFSVYSPLIPLPFFPQLHFQAGKAASSQPDD